MKKLPVGIENFEELRREDFYYIDKTGLIVDLMNGWGKVNLFTRPRRFGKTLNMNMLKAFFEVGGDKILFRGLKVSEEKELLDTYMGKYPVVSVSLKGVDGLTFEDAYEMLCSVIRREAFRLQFLCESPRLSEREKEAIQVLLNQKYTPTTAKNSLQILTAALERHYGQKVILLVDEYDVPLDKAFQNGYYRQMIDLLRAMFGTALKTNDSLFMAVLTGCLRISKESIFTGLNNLVVHSISDIRFGEYFGFTDKEVRHMLVDYGLETHYEEIRKWYDGYRFGNQNIYCPWDVVNYVYTLRSDPQAEPEAYWINTSGNDMVRRLIRKCSDGTAQMELERLIAGETVVKALNENLTHSEIEENMENIWSLLYMTGYLTITQRPSGGKYSLRIPNREIRQIYTQQVRQWFNEKAAAEADELGDFYAAFEKGDTETIADYLNRLLLDTVSFYDAHESFYHGFLLALLGTCAGWRVISNAETGRGRSDILVERKDRKVGFVVEVKEVKEEKKLDMACASAMKQIEDRDYTAALRRYRVKEIRSYGIAFWEKECRVVARLN